jgi:PAS domain S-box-containing protein
MNKSFGSGLRKVQSIRISGPLRFVLAVGIAAFAILLQVAFNTVLGSKIPLTLFLPAVIVSAGVGGFVPGILTTVLGCAFSAGYFWMAGPNLEILRTDILELVLFAGIGILLSFVIEAWRAETFRATQCEERLKATWSNVDDAVFATDENGCITEMNPVAEALTGWLLSEAKGGPAQNVFVTADDPVRRVLREGRGSGRINHAVLVSKTGREIPIDEIATPIKDAEGRVTDVIVVFRDTRPRHRSEQGPSEVVEADRPSGNEAGQAARGHVPAPASPGRDGEDGTRAAHF